MYFNNTKWYIRGSILSPATYLNDGLAEFITLPVFNSMFSVNESVEDLKNGSLGAYDQRIERSAHMKTHNRNFDSDGNLLPAPIEIDGEGHKFKSFAKHEVLKDGLEVIVDMDSIYQEGYTERKVKFASSSKPSYVLPTVLTLALAAALAYRHQDSLLAALNL